MKSMLEDVRKQTQYVVRIDFDLIVNSEWVLRWMDILSSNKHNFCGKRTAMFPCLAARALNYPPTPSLWAAGPCLWGKTCGSFSGWYPIRAQQWGQALPSDSALGRKQPDHHCHARSTGKFSAN
jgi:hypothetical protein